MQVTLLNENPHPCVAIRNIYIESMYLINRFWIGNFALIWCFVSCGLVEVNNNYCYRFVSDKQHYGKSKEYFASRKMQVPFSVPIGNAELRCECSPEHLCKGTVRLK